MWLKLFWAFWWVLVWPLVSGFSQEQPGQVDELNLRSMSTEELLMRASTLQQHINRNSSAALETLDYSKEAYEKLLREQAESKKALTNLRSINAELKNRLELSESQRSELQTKYEQSIKTVTSLEQSLQSWKDAGEKAIREAEARVVVAESKVMFWKRVATCSGIAASISVIFAILLLP